MNQTLVMTTQIFPLVPCEYSGCCPPIPGQPLGEWVKRELLSKDYTCTELEQISDGWTFLVEKSALTVRIEITYAAGEHEDGSDTEWFISSQFEIPNMFFKPNFWFRSTEGKAFAEQIMRELKYSIGNNLEMEIVRMQ